MPAITLILFICGIYLVVMTVKMKKTGVIPPGLISKRVNLERAKDIPGYINHMYMRGIVFGVVLSAISALLLYSDFYTVNAWVLLVAQLLYFAGIIYYGVTSVKAQNKYLFGGKNDK